MKKMKKTYLAPGFMEWQAIIHVGRATVKLNFTGGTFTGYGQAPASFETDNPVLQRLIEMSDLFRERRIVLKESDRIGVERRGVNPSAHDRFKGK